MIGDMLSGPSTMKVAHGCTLRLLSALEILQARREGEDLAHDGKERALCANASLVARALERGGTPIYLDGEAVLSHLTVEEIEGYARMWYTFSQQENPSAEDSEERVQQLKKGWSTHLMSVFAGVCSAPFRRSLQSPVPKK